LKLYKDWDVSAAQAACKRGLELEPRNSHVLRIAALIQGALGNFDEAISLGHQSIELDPLRTSTYMNLASHQFYAGRLNDSKATLRKALELTPNFPAAHCRLGIIHIFQSEFEQAFTDIQKEPEPFWQKQVLAIYYHATGKKNEADKVLNEYIQEFQKDAAFQIAEVFAYRGEIDKAFEWLERAYTQRDGGLMEMKEDPLLRNLENDSRWTAFLKKMKL
jgi:tetratricopeptide (TPR) repeat protein